MFGLISRDIPCCYNVGFESHDMPGLTISVHKDFVELLSSRTEKVSAMAERICKNNDFDGFSLDLNSDFGYFGGSFINKDLKGDFIKFLIPIPSVNIITKKDCCRCKGSGEDPHIGAGEACLICRGKGKELKENWTAMKKTVFSLSLFTNLARYSYGDVVIKTKQKQLIYFIVHAENDRSIGGDMSPRFCWYLNNIIGRTNLRNAVEAMNQANYQIWGKENNLCQAYVGENGFLVLDCSNGGLSPIYSVPQGNRGVEFSSNDDPTYADVIVLLSGLFAVCEQIRNEI